MVDYSFAASAPTRYDPSALMERHDSSDYLQKVPQQIDVHLPHSVHYGQHHGYHHHPSYHKNHPQSARPYNYGNNHNAPHSLGHHHHNGSAVGRQRNSLSLPHPQSPGTPPSD